jgi:uncharacterized membrane protein YqhA
VIKGLFAASRFVIALAVIATFAGSVVLLVSATLAVGRIIRLQIETFNTVDPKQKDVDPVNQIVRNLDHLGVQFIEITDIILLGTVLYIVSLGLYQLFIDRDVSIPGWLRVRDLAELKRNLISVTVVLLGVSFLGEVVDWNHRDSNIIFLGAGVALVVAALGFILYLTPAHTEPEVDEPGEETKAAGP